MLSISTAFNIKKHSSWESLLNEVKELGFSAVELNVETPKEWLEHIERSVLKGEIRISSLHNYVPRIESLPADRTIYSGYFLTSQDKDESGLAVTKTIETIEWASRLGAPAVVIHAGEVQTDPAGRDFAKYIHMSGKNGKLYGQYYDALMLDRKKKAPVFLDNLARSLEPCMNAALKKNVTLCLENRFHIHEIPNIEEAVYTLERFGKGAPLAYWHDTGHAEVFVRMGWVKKHTDFLDALSGKLYGMHLHDIHKLSDHYAPGTKEFDFTILKPYIKPETLLIIEAHSKSSNEELKQSIPYLRKAGLIN